MTDHFEPAAVTVLRARVWKYMNEDDGEYAVDIMEDFLKLLGSTLPHKETDLRAGASLGASPLEVEERQDDTKR